MATIISLQSFHIRLAYTHIIQMHDFENIISNQIILSDSLHKLVFRKEKSREPEIYVRIELPE